MAIENLTPKNWIGKKKEGEIYRFQLMMVELNLKPEDIHRDTGVTVRTITNSIYEEKPLGAKLLREVHSKYGVSLDWLISGKGKMLSSSVPNTSYVSENAAKYSSENCRLENVIGLVSEFMSHAGEDEKAWLEMQMKFNISLYRQYLKNAKNDD